MELVRGLVNLSEQHKDCVLTIGNFDGVHIGHQHVLNKLKAESKKHGVPSAVMLFEPQPQEFFLGDKAAARILTFRDKFRKLEKMGIDRLVCVRFNKSFASLAADEFIEDLLVAKLGVKHLIVGDDFKFGVKRSGDFELLKKESELCGFSVEDTKTFTYSDTDSDVDSNKRASSTAIRQSLSASKFEKAAELLGEPFAMQGRVIHGQKNGRKFGFPTANIAVKRKVLPIKGVFLVAINSDEKEYYGVANIGNKPTLNGVEPVLEVHIFNFDQNIYGHRLSIKPLEKIRDEQKFASIEQLISQIKLDVANAKSKLSQNGIK